jgi:hypothetical protein
VFTLEALKFRCGGDKTMSENVENEEVMYERANVETNGNFILLETLSGYYGSLRDPKGRQHLLPFGASDQELGVALNDALSYSRIVKTKDAPDLYAPLEEQEQRYANFVQSLMQSYGYKTRRALFKNMKLLSVHRRREGLMTLFPTKHDRLEGWSGLPEENNVIIPSDSSAHEIGTAIRMALSRCIG